VRWTDLSVGVGDTIELESPNRAEEETGYAMLADDYLWDGQEEPRAGSRVSGPGRGASSRKVTEVSAQKWLGPRSPLAWLVTAVE